MLEHCCRPARIVALLLFGAAMWAMPVPHCSALQDEMPPDIQFDLEGMDITEDADFGAPPLDDDEKAVLVWAPVVMIGCGVVLGVLSVALSIYIAYVGFSVLEMLPESSRPMPSFVPWLLLVPLVNLVVLFMIFVQIPEAVQRELEARGQAVEGDFGRTLGIIGAVLSVLGCTVPIGAILIWIATMRLAGAKRQLLESQAVKA